MEIKIGTKVKIRAGLVGVVLCLKEQNKGENYNENI